MERKIPNKLFFKIGEVCELTDIQPYVLRYWETEFPSLAPAKNSSGQRIYRRRDIETVVRIKELLYGEGFTVAGARKKLEQEQAGRVDTPISQAALDSAFADGEAEVPPAAGSVGPTPAPHGRSRGQATASLDAGANGAAKPAASQNEPSSTKQVDAVEAKRAVAESESRDARTREVLKEIRNELRALSEMLAQKR